MIVKQHFFYFYNFFAIPFLWDPCFTQGIPRFRIFRHSSIPPFYYSHPVKLQVSWKERTQMCIEYRTNEILPHPLPPGKKYDNKHWEISGRNYIKIGIILLLTVTLSLTRARFTAASLPIKIEAAATKTRLNRKLLPKTKKEDSIWQYTISFHSSLSFYLQSAIPSTCRVKRLIQR